MESWLDIEGYIGGYQISGCGRVKSLARRVWRGGKSPCWLTVKERILKPGTDTDGYLRVSLSDHVGNQTTHKIHRLVAQAFLPNPSHLPQVNHIDKDKKNNHVSNLEWTTNELNSQHSAKLTAEQIRQIRKLAAAGVPQKQIAVMFGVSRDQVSAIVRRVQWRNVIRNRPISKLRPSQRHGWHKAGVKAKTQRVMWHPRTSGVGISAPRSAL